MIKINIVTIDGRRINEYYFTRQAMRRIIDIINENDENREIFMIGHVYNWNAFKQCFKNLFYRKY